ncbi:hypothetical protein L1887_52097 [Cichorium endivia]|nr:hypothetical protein L1887_52097 [Cichorium endivia]
MQFASFCYPWARYLSLSHSCVRDLPHRSHIIVSVAHDTRAGALLTARGVATPRPSSPCPCCTPPRVAGLDMSNSCIVTASRVRACRACGLEPSGGARSRAVQGCGASAPAHAVWGVWTDDGVLGLRGRRGRRRRGPRRPGR